MLHYFSGNDHDLDLAMHARLFSYMYIGTRKKLPLFLEGKYKAKMKVYLAGLMSFISDTGTDVDVTRSAQIESVLESYYYMDDKKIKLAAEEGWHVMLDSGAYTAFVKGKKIDIQEYIDFVLKTREHWDIVAGLDVIGDAEASWKNFEIMRDAGINVMPTFHYGEPWEFLDMMVEAAPYVAVGGVAQLGAGPGLIEWLDSVWSNHLVNKDGTPKVKVHGFAITGVKVMQRYPWASVDSTAWLQQAAYGRCILDLPDGQGGIKDLKLAFSEHSPFAEKDNWHFDSMSPANQKVVRTHLEGLGYDLEKLRTSYRWRQHVNIGYFRRAENRGVTRFIRQQEGLFF